MKKLERHSLRAIALFILCFHLAGCDFLSEADVPVLKSEINVDGEKLYGLQGNFKWLDNDRIIAINRDYVKAMPTGSPYVFQHLVIWDTADNTIKSLPYAHVGGLCVGDGFVRFYNQVRHVVPENGGVSVDDEKDGLERYYGPLDHLKKVKLTSPLDTISCKQKDQVPLPAWAQSIPDINIIRLKPEHGFIWIERDAKKLSEKPKGLWLYPPNTGKSQGIDISKIIGDYRYKGSYGNIKEFTGFSRDVKYYEYKKAYLATHLGDDWWIYPDGKLESFSFFEVRKRLDPLKSESEYIKTNSGFIFGTRDIKSLNVRNNDGLFFVKNSFEFKRLVKGRIGYELEVSPDGCKVAYSIDRRETLDSPPHRKLAPNLEVINVCKEQLS